MVPLENHITLRWETTHYNSRKRKRCRNHWGARTEIIVWFGVYGTVLEKGFLGYTRARALQRAKMWSKRYQRIPLVLWGDCEVEIWPRPGRKLKRMVG